MEKEELLKMDLHEVRKIKAGGVGETEILRVFGGWIYRVDYHTGDNMCFVPEVINAEAHVTNHY